MTFTDDDLKRLKEELTIFDDGWNCQECGLNQHIDFKALLARLEAAEGLFNSKHEEGGSEWWLDFEESKRAWRKACGR